MRNIGTFSLARIIRIMMSSGLLLAIAACSGGGSPGSDTIAAAETSATPEPVTEGQTIAAAVAAAGEDGASTEPASDTSVAEAAEPLEPVGPTDAQLALANASPDQCGPGARFIAGGPPGFDGGGLEGGGTAGQSLFEAAANTDSGRDGQRISVDPSPRAGRFIRFGNPAAPTPVRSRPSKRNLKLKPSSLAGNWSLTDGSPACACTVQLSGGSGETNPASTSTCSSGNLAQIASWRLRGEEIVLLGDDRTVLATVFTTDGKVFTGGVSTGGLATLWRP